MGVPERTERDGGLLVGERGFTLAFHFGQCSDERVPVAELGGHGVGVVFGASSEEQQHEGRSLHDGCGCRKLCRGWSCGISVLVDESATAGRFHDLEVSIWLVCSVGGDGRSLIE